MEQRKKVFPAQTNSVMMGLAFVKSARYLEEDI